MTAATRRLDAREAQRVLVRLGVAPQDWPPGASFALAREIEPSAMVRLGNPEPGEGYHREHLRLLRGAGAASALGDLTARVVQGCDQRLRLETELPAETAAAWGAACGAAGLEREVLLPAAWRPAPQAEAVDLELWGRPGRLPPRPPPASPALGRAPLDAELRLVTHEASTRELLRAFLDRLVPGRSYPPGVILSDAERAETRRPGDLDADWVLALAEDGSVAGAVVLEPDGRPERLHVRRLHVDVARGFRGRGVATQLLRFARRRAAQLGVDRVEADPRSGHRAVLAALEGAGLVDCGRQTAAWRMRTAAASWDEDLVLLSAPT